MDALILAAGYSKRLEPLTLTCAKPLLSVGGRPMVEYVLDKVRQVPDVRRITLICNDRFYPDFVAWGRRHPDVCIVNDGTQDHEHRLGAIGDIEFAIRAQNLTDDLAIVAGDNLFDASLAGFVAQARAHVPCVSIGIVDLKDPDLIRKRYGVVQMDPTDRLTVFVEKPETPATTLVSTGIYFFPAEQLGTVLGYLERKGNPDNIGYLIRALVDSPGVYGCLLPGRWYDIGDLQSYELANREYERQKGAEAER